MKKGKIRGCPGAGKTRYLLELITRAAEKYSPERIGAISYTNASVEEMKSRARIKMDLDGSQTSNIRTIHSHCFNLLGVRKDMIAETHINEFNDEYPDFQISGQKLDSLDVYNDFNTKRNDLLFAEMNVMRNRMIPESHWNIDVRAFWQSWQSWMLESGYIDFTGMLERILMLRRTPDIDVLFIDEAQDMSMLQARVTELWAQQTVSSIWVGDPDQSIFRFAGSEPEAFNTLDAEWNKYLSRTYRLPRSILEFCGGILDKMTNRQVMDIETDKEGGEVIFSHEPDFTLPGSHMIITRCNYQLKRWTELLRKSELLWHNPYRASDKTWNPAGTKSYKAARLYSRLMKGGYLNLQELRALSEATISRGNLQRGAKTEIAGIDRLEEDVDIFTIGKYGFLDEFMRDDKPLGEKLKLTGLAGEMVLQTPGLVEREPNIIIGTIHSVKGGEADNVWVDCELPYNVRKSISRDEVARNDELRVFYVACTRSRNRLGLINHNSIAGV